MYLISRSRFIRPGDDRAAMAAALEAASRVKQISGLDIGVWTTMMSPRSGMVAWTGQVEHLSEVEMATDKLAADGGYLDWVASVDSHFTGPFTDGALQVISGEPSADSPAYAQVATAVCANGAVSAAMAAGVEIAETATRLTGHTTLFCSSVTGPFGAVAWVTGVPDLDALEAGGEATAASPEWLSLMAGIGPSFATGAEVTLWRRTS